MNTETFTVDTRSGTILRRGQAVDDHEITVEIEAELEAEIGDRFPIGVGSDLLLSPEKGTETITTPRGDFQLSAVVAPSTGSVVGPQAALVWAIITGTLEHFTRSSIVVVRGLPVMACQWELSDIVLAALEGGDPGFVFSTHKGGQLEWREASGLCTVTLDVLPRSLSWDSGNVEILRRIGVALAVAGFGTVATPAADYLTSHQALVDDSDDSDESEEPDVATENVDLSAFPLDVRDQVQFVAVAARREGSEKELSELHARYRELHGQKREEPPESREALAFEVIAGETYGTTSASFLLAIALATGTIQ